MAEQKLIVANKSNGVQQTVVVKDGKWHNEAGTPWSDKLRAKYNVVGPVKAEPSKEAKGLTQGAATPTAEAPKG